MVSNRKKKMLKELAESQEKCAQLSHLNHAIPLGFFKRIRDKIEAEAENSHPLKLPVLFFFLVRHDLKSLLNFDYFLGRLKQSHRKREFPNLLHRLLEEENYRNTVGAIFEVEILAKLLDTREPISVALYPKIPGTQKRPEASISLAQKAVYIEATVLSQTEDQEEIQDIGATSLYEQVLLSDLEKERLGISSVQDGGVGGVGDPYGDALRVIGKLDEKREQLAPQNPNVICLGLADLDPDIVSVEWAIEDIFSGSPTMAQRVRDRHKRDLEAKRAAMTAEPVSYTHLTLPTTPYV